ncbi:YhfH family protein [Pontibacillus yanchengensis]|nr:YhfH family protein [Pontibacillus yanchengensis]
MTQIKMSAHACPECGEKMDSNSQKYMMECERCLSKQEE